MTSFQASPINTSSPEPPRYRPGDKEDFDRLYQAMYQRIFRTLISITGDPAGG